MSESVIGIDLGTTNSCVAVIFDGILDEVPYNGTSPLIPSVVSFDDDGKPLIGVEAQKRAVTHPEDTIYGAKRLMGRVFGSGEMDELRNKFNYRIVEGATKEPLVVAGGRRLTLEQVSGLILKEAKLAAETYLQERVARAVISVPAYFSQRQRRSVREAAKLAGIDVMRIINEPTAAALAIGVRSKWRKKRFLVYDLGGGTFDVSIITLNKNIYDVNGTCGNSFLGGIDFDNAILERLARTVEKKTGHSVSDNPLAQQRLRDEAEAAKKALSEQGRYKVDLPALFESDGGAVDFECNITRPAIEELCTPLVKKTLKYVERALKESELNPYHMDELVLVGGMTHMPLVRKAVSKYFHKEPHTEFDPNTIVAQGAAILAEAIRTKKSDRIFRDVLSVSIGLALPDGKYRKLINKNTQLPVSKTHRFKTTHNNQTKLTLKLQQGESRYSENNEFLGQVEITGIPKMPKGKIGVEVEFSLDEDSILTVTSRHPGSGFETVTEFTTDRSEEQDVQADDSDVPMEDLEPVDEESASVEYDPPTPPVATVESTPPAFDAVDEDPEPPSPMAPPLEE